MKGKYSLIAAAALGALTLVGATAAAGSGGGGAQTAATATVSMGDNFFKPSKLRVKPGTAISWKNNGQVQHNATADNGSFRTGNLSPGQSGSATLRRLGKYLYSCTIHPGMDGVLKVCKRKNAQLICSK